MSSRFLFHLWQKKVRSGACPLFMFHFGLGAWDFVSVLPRLFHKGRNTLSWASILLACMEPCRFGGFAPTNGYIFDLVTGTFPDALFQHNWWVILMAVATPRKRTPLGLGSASVPRNLLGKLFDIASSSSTKIEWLRFLGIFVRVFSLKNTLVSRKIWICLGCTQSSCKSTSYFWENNGLEQIQINNLKSRQVNKKMLHSFKDSKSQNP